MHPIHIYICMYVCKHIQVHGTLGAYWRSCETITSEDRSYELLPSGRQQTVRWERGLGFRVPGDSKTA